MTQNWAKALNISSKQIQEWASMVPEGTPLLPWCLENDLISTAAYMTWASQAYSLPILNRNYFEEVFDRHDFVTSRHSGLWSRYCFPIGQWEDATFIACVEPATELPEDGKYVCVLTEPHVMSQIWDSASLGEQASEIIDAPAGINLNASTSFQLNLDNVTLEDPHSDSNRIATANTLPPLPNNMPLPTPLKPPTKPSGPPPKASPPPHDLFAALFKEGALELAPEYSVYMMLSREEGLLKPFMWSEELQAGNGINLTNPSFFRIVAKTQQAYHGYVVDSALHREFFNGIGLEELPSCATVVPLMVKGKMWGVLAAFGGEAAQSAEALEKCHTFASKLSLKVNPSGGQQAA